MSPLKPRKSDPLLNHSQIRSLRYVYMFALSLTAISHVMTITIVMFALLFPSLFTADIAAFLHPLAVFIPQSPLSVDKVTSAAQGCLYLLQYDMYFACGVTLVWAQDLYNAANRGASCVGSHLKVIFLTLLFGPGGAALGIIWMRDEQVIKQEKLKSEEKSM